MEEDLGVDLSPPSLLLSPIINLLHNAPTANVLSVNLCVLVLLVMRLLIRVNCSLVVTLQETSVLRDQVRLLDSYPHSTGIIVPEEKVR